MRLLVAILVVALQRVSCNNATNFTEIPQDLMLGTATSAYQVEGAWNESGKGVSIWDTYVHVHPELIADHCTGDVAADSFHQLKRDVALLKQLHVDFYRFSISWTRILPEGHVNSINPDGIKYYADLINNLEENNITCMVAMHHWDLPQRLQDLGGWTNPVMADYFEDYARVLFKNFGDKVKTWVTIMEPDNIARSYNVSWRKAPGVDSPRVGLYLAAHTLITAHARVYHMYKNEFFDKQKGKVGISLNSKWFEPYDKNSQADMAARDEAIQYQLGLFANPIFHKDGDYPQVWKKNLHKLSIAQGYQRSRLRDFENVTFIKGSADFLGLNYYTTRLVQPGGWTDNRTAPDENYTLSVNTSWPSSATSYLKVVPWGLRELLKWIKQQYQNPEVIITENGYSDHGELHDVDRVKYIVSHLQEAIKAKVEDSCNVTAYTVWTLLDNFEWDKGYTEKFGLVQVDFNDTERKRTPKTSAHVFSEITERRRLPVYSVTQTGAIDVNLTFFEYIRLHPEPSGASSMLHRTSSLLYLCLTGLLYTGYVFGS